MVSQSVGQFTSSTRQRLWDGHDQFYSDNLSQLHGNHLFQYGGSYLRSSIYFQRNDNGASTDSYIVYQLTNGSGISVYPTPSNLPSSQATTYDQLYSEVLGIVGQSQVLYTRNGPNLALNPAGVPAVANSIIPTYDVYFSDSWHIKPTLTLTYGLAWALSMPPYATDGHQVVLVDSSGQEVSTASFLKLRENAALSGQAFAPEIGFATPESIGEKYPFRPFYGSFSPRVSIAWNPNLAGGLVGKILGQNQTVIRAGYSRIYGRLNGVEEVLAPLTSPGITQAVACYPAANGSCASTGSLTATTAFRIGTDGLSAPLTPVTQTLQEPYWPGVNGNAAASDGSSNDANYRPDYSDEVNVTIQRALSTRALVEVGYLGKRMRDLFLGVNIDPVPTMMTLNGQSFAQAYSNVYSEYCGLSSPACAVNASAVTAQPFFEAALSGSGSAFCSGYSSCTAAVIAQYGSSIKATQVYTLWQSLSQANGWTLGRTLLSSPALGTNISAQLTATDMRTSLGYGNYNAGFVRFTTKDWHGVTTTSNFTYGRSLGTASLPSSGSAATVPDPYDLAVGYGPTAFDYKVVLHAAHALPGSGLQDAAGPAWAPSGRLVDRAGVHRAGRRAVADQCQYREQSGCAGVRRGLRKQQRRLLRERDSDFELHRWKYAAFRRGAFGWRCDQRNFGVGFVREPGRDLRRVPASRARHGLEHERRRADPRLPDLESRCDRFQSDRDPRTVQRDSSVPIRERLESFPTCEPEHGHQQPADLGCGYGAGDDACGGAIALDGVRAAARILGVDVMNASLWLAFVAAALYGFAQTPSGEFRIVLTGDSMIQGRLSIYDEPEYLDLVHRIQKADVSFTNFEMLVHNFEYAPAPMSGGLYLQAYPLVLDELKWMGFGLFSLANNHAYDYGADGLLSTMRAFEKAGMAYAGVGENLARARAPAYFDTKKGRVALIACASTFPVIGPAGEQRVDLQGRPGVSPLRVKTTYTVDGATLSALRQLAGGGRGNAQGDLHFLGATFHAGEKLAVTTEADAKDVAGIVAGIHAARRMADWVVVSIHAHESAPRKVELPADFLIPFAHAAIDAGADVFFAHGPHVLRGIEIYKRKPVFYSMGNFIFQNDLVPFQPQDEMNQANLPPDASAPDFYDTRDGTTYSDGIEKNTRSFPANKEYWESMVAEPVFNSKHELLTIELTPVALGFGKTRPQRGRPVLAGTDEARAIIERVAKLSSAMGTTVDFREGNGVVTIH